MSGEHYESIWSHLTDVAFRQDWIDAGELRTRYVEAGRYDAPVVIMLHGIGGSWEAFCANIGAFSKSFRVLAFDMIGSGFTDKPEQPIYEMTDYVRHLRSFMEATNVSRAALVGVSMGGWTAVNFAFRYPELVDKIVLCAVSGLRREPQQVVPTAVKLREDRMKAIDDPTWENIARLFDDLIYTKEKRNPDFVKLRQTIYRLPEMKASMRRLMAITENEAFNRSAMSDDEWRKVSVPALLIDSIHDNAHFRRNAARAEALLPRAQRAEMSEVAHWPQFENPDAFNSLVLDFLGRSDP